MNRKTKRAFIRNMKNFMQLRSKRKKTGGFGPIPNYIKEARKNTEERKKERLKNDKG